MTVSAVAQRYLYWQAFGLPHRWLLVAAAAAAATVVVGLEHAALATARSDSAILSKTNIEGKNIKTLNRKCSDVLDQIYLILWIKLFVWRYMWHILNEIW